MPDVKELADDIASKKAAKHEASLRTIEQSTLKNSSMELRNQPPKAVPRVIPTATNNAKPPSKPAAPRPSADKKMCLIF